MAFDGTGIFRRLYDWTLDAANGLLVDAGRMDADTDDIANGLSNCITLYGQSTPLANLPMGGKKFTGLGPGMNAGDSVNYGQVFNQATFVSPSVAAAAGLNANPLRVASISDVLAAAYSTALPGQPGGTTTYALLSTGGAASWQPFLAQVQAAALSF